MLIGGFRGHGRALNEASIKEESKFGTSWNRMTKFAGMGSLENIHICKYAINKNSVLIPGSNFSDFYRRKNVSGVSHAKIIRCMWVKKAFHRHSATYYDSTD